VANTATEPRAGSCGDSAVTATHLSICYEKRRRMSDNLDSTDVTDNVDRSCRQARARRNGGRKGSRATGDVCCESVLVVETRRRFR
jgi:hypothetical protein